MLYYIKSFNPKQNREKIKKYFENIVMPYIENEGFKGKLMETIFGLSTKEYIFIVEIENLKAMALYDELFEKETSKEISANLEKMIKDSDTIVCNDIEDDKWLILKDKLYHMEYLDIIVECDIFEDFFMNEAFEYLREKKFKLKVLKVKYGFSTRKYLFITEMDEMGDIDNWQSRTSLELKGEKIMDKLVSYVDIPKANIVKNIY
ncbi:MAG: hypothetical protein RBR71_11805 [Gudongella sp.]|nr:hypothetical protein [Gudongella sp.]